MMQGLQIKLRHRVTLTFDLFTPKVDRFIPRSVDHSCQFVAKPFLSASLYTLVKEALIEIGCVVTSLVVGWLVGWLSRACTVAKRCILGL